MTDAALTARAIEIARAVLDEYPKPGPMHNVPDRRKYTTNHLMELSRAVLALSHPTPTQATLTPDEAMTEMVRESERLGLYTDPAALPNAPAPTQGSTEGEGEDELKQAIRLAYDIVCDDMPKEWNFESSARDLADAIVTMEAQRKYALLGIQKASPPSAQSIRLAALETALEKIRDEYLSEDSDGIDVMFEIACEALATAPKQEEEKAKPPTKD